MSKIIIAIAVISILLLIAKIKKSYIKLQVKIFKAWAKMKIERIWEVIRIYVIIALSISIGYSACFVPTEYQKLQKDYNSAIEASQSAKITLRSIETAQAATNDQIEAINAESAKIEAKYATPEQIINSKTNAAILHKVHMLESSYGKNDGCKAKGKVNGFGFRQNSGEWKCFDTFDEVATAVDNWYTEQLKTKNLDQALCWYNEGKDENSCTYSINYKKI